MPEGSLSHQQGKVGDPHLKLAIHLILKEVRNFRGLKFGSLQTIIKESRVTLL